MDFLAVQIKPTVLLFASTCGIFFCYLLSLGIYRLYFSPLAKFPGPRLAALTNWYEFYYELIQAGQFTSKIQELHKQYGAQSLWDFCHERLIVERPNCAHHA